MNYSREQLFGKWYRIDLNEEGQQISEFAEMSSDGSYKFTFSTLNNNREVSQQDVELGDWGIVGDIHFTFARGELVGQEFYEADMTNADNYHAYRILQLDSKNFEYQHVVTNEVFIMRRVIDNIAQC